MSGLGIIAPEPDTICAQCGTITECRPYGANNEQICVECAMSTPKSQAIAEKKMAAYIFGVSDSEIIK